VSLSFPIKIQSIFHICHRGADGKVISLILPGKAREFLAAQAGMLCAFDTMMWYNDDWFGPSTEAVQWNRLDFAFLRRIDCQSFLTLLSPYLDPTIREIPPEVAKTLCSYQGVGPVDLRHPTDHPDLEAPVASVHLLPYRQIKVTHDYRGSPVVSDLNRIGFRICSIDVNLIRAGPEPSMFGYSEESLISQARYLDQSDGGYRARVVGTIVEPQNCIEVRKSRSRYLLF